MFVCMFTGFCIACCLGSNATFSTNKPSCKHLMPVSHCVTQTWTWGMLFQAKSRKLSKKLKTLDQLRSVASLQEEEFFDEWLQDHNHQ